MAVIVIPEDDGFVRLRIYSVDAFGNADKCVNSVALYPEGARTIAMNLTKASIECEERKK